MGGSDARIGAAVTLDPSASIALDRAALDWLGRLLDADAEQRSRELEVLHATHPALGARVARLLAAGSADDGTLAVAAPAREAWLAIGSGPGSGTSAAADAGTSTGAVPSGATPGSLRADNARPDLAGRLIAGYRLLRPLGQGGMAAVWLAERADGQLKRHVAIKLPLASQISAVLAERFARERDVLAALDHPHIARLIDAGVSAAGVGDAGSGDAGGQPYIVLEHVDGVRITEYAESLDLRARIALFLQVLDAVDHAHRHMTVHRDLKPANILVDRQGQVKLLDFGIAKLLAPPPGTLELTQDAAQVLTPRYAAPEQVKGAAVSAATDQYAAAVVLYELLTGQLPYEPPHNSLAALLHAVAEGEVLPPRLSTDLDTVLLKALRKTPDERYASVERFAEDLKRVLAHQPILARRVPWWQRLALLLRRHRAAAAAAGAAALVLLTAGGVAWQQSRESKAQQARADRVRDFVFQMVSDAEPLEGKSEVTGLEMVDAAVERAREEFVADPALRGQLLGELGRVYHRLQQPQKAIATLEEALRLFDADTGDVQGAARARTQGVLAATLVHRDDDRARALAEQAIAACSAQRPATTVGGTECAEARGWAHYTLHLMANWRGRLDESLREARSQAVAFEQAFGAEHLSMVPALDVLAVAARSRGELRESAAAVARAQAIARGKPLRASLRSRLDLLQATTDIDAGRHAAAREQLVRQFAGPLSDTERSIRWRWLAQAEIGLGRPAAALAAAEASRRAAPDNVLRVLARLSWAEAASRLGRHDEAAAEAAQALAGFARAGTDPQSDWVLRARRVAAEIALRDGRFDEARAALKALLDDHAKPAAAQSVEWALALDALGCAESASAVAASGQADGRAPEQEQQRSRAHHAAASTRYAATLDADHPLRLRNAWLGSGSAPSWQRWQDGLAADSPWRGAAPSDCRRVM